MGECKSEGGLADRPAANGDSWIVAPRRQRGAEARGALLEGTDGRPKEKDMKGAEGGAGEARRENGRTRPTEYAGGGAGRGWTGLGCAAQRSAVRRSRKGSGNETRHSPLHRTSRHLGACTAGPG